MINIINSYDSTPHRVQYTNFIKNKAYITVALQKPTYINYCCFIKTFSYGPFNDYSVATCTQCTFDVPSLEQLIGEGNQLGITRSNTLHLVFLLNHKCLLIYTAKLNLKQNWSQFWYFLMLESTEKPLP